MTFGRYPDVPLALSRERLAEARVARYSNPGICSVRVFCGIQIPELVELFVLKSRTETDARKKVSVIFVLISRTNFSRNFGVHPSDGTVEMGTDYHQLLFDGQ